jgi:hypothetical protein
VKAAIASAQQTEFIKPPKRKREETNMTEESAPPDKKKKVAAIISMVRSIYKLESESMDVDG